MLYLNFKTNFAFNCSVCSAKEPQFNDHPLLVMFLARPAQPTAQR